MISKTPNGNTTHSHSRSRSHTQKLYSSFHAPPPVLCYSCARICPPHRHNSFFFTLQKISFPPSLFFSFVSFPANTVSAHTSLPTKTNPLPRKDCPPSSIFVFGTFSLLPPRPIGVPSVVSLSTSVGFGPNPKRAIQSCFRSKLPNLIVATFPVDRAHPRSPRSCLCVSVLCAV